VLADVAHAGKQVRFSVDGVGVREEMLCTKSVLLLGACSPGEKAAKRHDSGLSIKSRTVRAFLP
jgi:hypothetical protein